MHLFGQKGQSILPEASEKPRQDLQLSFAPGFFQQAHEACFSSGQAFHILGQQLHLRPCSLQQHQELHPQLWR